MKVRIEHQGGDMRWPNYEAPLMLTLEYHIIMGDNMKSRDRVRTSPLFARESLIPRDEKAGNQQNGVFKLNFVLWLTAGSLKGRKCIRKLTKPWTL